MSSSVFSFETINTLYKDCDTLTKGKETITILSNQLKAYIDQFFFSTNTGGFYFYDHAKGEFISHTKETLNLAYFHRMPREIGTTFFTSQKIYQTIMDTHKPRVSGTSINMFHGFIHPSKEYSTYKPEVKEKVELFLAYIKEVLAHDDEDVFDYLIKWIANMTRGNKNDSVLYLKSIEGTGKSTLSDFLKDFVVGRKNATMSDSEPLLTAYNKELCGKLFVVFEELPTFSDRQWEGVSSKIKKAVTADTEKYSDKFEKRFECENLNNYIINTNVEALKHSEGRRYFLLDISTHRKGDHQYFKKLRENCFNLTIGEAFFNYLRSVDIEGFNSQADMPETSNKKDAIVDRLDYVYRFIKEDYIFQRKEINSTVQDLVNEYENFCKAHDKKPLTKTKFSQKMKDINLNYYASCGKNKYHFKLQKLKEIAKKHNWIHELDDYVDNDVDPDEAEKLTYVDLISQNKELEKEIKELKKKINADTLSGTIVNNITINNTREYDPPSPQIKGNYFAKHLVQEYDPPSPQIKENYFANKTKVNTNKVKKTGADEIINAF